jgi:hypothetical protein
MQYTIILMRLLCQTMAGFYPDSMSISSPEVKKGGWNSLKE